MKKDTKEVEKQITAFKDFIANNASRNNSGSELCDTQKFMDSNFKKHTEEENIVESATSFDEQQDYDEKIVS